MAAVLTYAEKQNAASSQYILWPNSNPTPHGLTDLEARSREVRECVRAVPLSDHQVSESVNEPLLPPYRKSAPMLTLGKGITHSS